MTRIDTDLTAEIAKIAELYGERGRTNLNTQLSTLDVSKPRISRACRDGREHGG
jgi:hypothetical protein